MTNKPMCSGDTHVWAEDHKLRVCMCGEKSRPTKSNAEIKEDIREVNKAVHFTKCMEGKLCQ